MDEQHDALVAHVARFNEGVRTGDFGPMLETFATEATLVFEGVPAGPFEGRDAIAQAYREQPPDDEILLLGQPRLEDGAIVSDYAWAIDRQRAGRMLLTVADGWIARLVVTFEPR